MDHICRPSPWTSLWIRSIDYPVDHPQFLKMNFIREVLTNFRNLKWTLCCGQVMGSLYFKPFFLYNNTLFHIYVQRKNFQKLSKTRKKVAKLQFTQQLLKKEKTNKQTKRQTTYYTCQLFLRYKCEIFILGVLGFLKTIPSFLKIPEEVRSLPKKSEVCRRRSYRENGYPQTQRS